MEELSEAPPPSNAWSPHAPYQDLQKQFDARISAYLPQTNESSRNWAELANDTSPRLTQYVIGCFSRGLCLEAIVNDDKLVAEIFEKFVTLLEQALYAPTVPPTGAGKSGLAESDS